MTRHIHPTTLLTIAGLLLAGCREPERPSGPAPVQTAETPAASTAPVAARRGVLQHQRTSLVAEQKQDCAPVTDDKLWRFIEGVDVCPSPLADADAARELNDPWGAQVLRAKVFPTTVDAIVAAVAAKLPTMVANQKSYVVGEGSQVPVLVAPREDGRSLRYVVTWGESTSPSVFLSALPGGDSSFLQVIAWDSTKNRYNFYEYSTKQPGWMWAGDSSFARGAETLGRGCFDCHHNGTVLMKELSTPWNNWHSMLAPIDPGVVPEAVAAEALFKHVATGDLLEASVRGGWNTYHSARIRGLVQRQQDGTSLISGVPELLSHVVSQTTVNLISTQDPSDPARAADPTAPLSAPPLEFFLRSSVLGDVVGLELTVPTLQLARKDYDPYIKDHSYQLVQTDSIPNYTAPGSTYFSFFVPVASDEDTLVITLLLGYQLITPKLIAAAQMVDFANPVLSPARESLLKYAAKLPTGTITGGKSDIPERFAALVSEGTKGQPTCDPTHLERCTAEQQFLHYWNLPEGKWQTEAQSRLQKYLDAVGGRVGTPQGLDDYMRLAASRREQFRTWPVIGNLVEFSLLFPRSDLPAAPPLRMHVEGTVGPDVAAPL